MDVALGRAHVEYRLIMVSCCFLAVSFAIKGCSED